MCILLKRVKCECGAEFAYTRADVCHRYLKEEGKKSAKVDFVICTKCCQKIVIATKMHKNT